MSKWEVLQLKIRAESKLHIGSLQKGVVELTQRYITGKNLWGALTSVLTRSQMGEYTPEQYVNIGEILKKYTRCTYCHVLEEIGEDDYLLVPGYTAFGLEYQRIPLTKNNQTISKISDYTFENKYISSYTSTALDYKSYTSLDESLHEIEYIKPGTRFLGYMFYRKEDLKQKGIEAEELKRLIKESVGLQGLGGSRSRGFGKVHIEVEQLALASVAPMFYEQDEVYLPYLVSLEEEDLIVTLREGQNTTLLPIVFRAEDGKDYLNFKGDLAPLVGREWADSGAGQNLSKSNCVILPGSTFVLEREVKMNLSYEGLLTPWRCDQ